MINVKSNTEWIEEFLRYLSLEKRYSAHTTLAYQNDLSKLEQYLFDSGEVPFYEVNDFIIRAWMVQSIHSGDSSRTVHRRLAAFNTFFNYLLVQNVLDQNPVERVQKPKLEKKLPEIMREDEMLTLFEQVTFEEGFEGVRDRLVMELLYGTGMRLSELIGLKVDDFRNGLKTVKVLGKRNKERLLPLYNELQKLIEEYLDLRAETFADAGHYLILTNRGEKVYPKFVYRIVNMYLGKVTSRSKKSPHVLRHSFATHLLNKGGDLNAIKELLGHANLAATEVYTHSSIEELKRVFNQAHPRGGVKKN